MSGICSDRAARITLAGFLLCFCAAAHGQHVSLWGGAGLGSFLAGGSGDPNWHRLLIVDIALPGDEFELRALKGTFERSRDIPRDVGDDDLDYKGLDAVLTRRLTGLPVDLAVGAVRYEEEYHLGYPNYDLGGREFVHRWGPHLSALRWWPATRFGQLWVEADLHYGPYQPRQLVLFLDAGLGLRL
jgi:hypothetical protein